MDNLSGTFSSSMIAEMVTAEDEFEARELGVSRNIAIDPRNFVIHATANNVSMDAELANRTMPLSASMPVWSDRTTGTPSGIPTL